jgi:hypothetical protein
MEGFEEYKLMNAALMRKNAGSYGRMFLNVKTAMAGGSQVSLGKNFTKLQK